MEQDLFNTINASLENISLQVVTLEPEDIPAMGVLLNDLARLEEKAAGLQDPIFPQITAGLKGYCERLVLCETAEMAPLEKGVCALQAHFRSLVSDAPQEIDPSEALALLGAPETGEAQASPAEAVCPEPGKSRLSPEDLQILADFAVESMENLDAIELSLMALEQDPEDSDTINAIFRPFHTIKGVSGFLNLQTINRLAHSTENLLDSARKGDFVISDAIIDTILESVDTLKKLIGNVKDNLCGGETDLEGGLDVDPLIVRIEGLNAQASSGNAQPIGEILLASGAVKRTDVQQGLEKQKQNPQKKLGEILMDERVVGPQEVICALRQQKEDKRVVELQVKVDTHKLDNLVDLTGEMVISQSMLRQNYQLLGLSDHAFDKNLNQLSQIVSGLQKISMSLRMVPIRSTFQKMVRLVRDLSRASGKKVDLKMSGEDTEIDRNVVDELYEPLVHMIRNAADHGLETPEERRAAGKDDTGLIELRAYHQGGSILIEISDDGRGLDTQRILKKALSLNLIPPDAKLSQPEIFDLIFHPGFSTAKAVTAVSGRGVGMDVVKKGIEKLRGHVEVRSQPGRGTTVVISLPLTLAIIDGMVVRVGRERYILPTMAILESFRPKKEDCFTVEGKGELIMSRGHLMPLIRLGEVFHVESEARHPWEGLVVAVEHKNEQKALLLDELVGKEEVVIKNLGGYLKNVKGLAGGAIMGDGRVGLIVDIAGLYDIALQ
jgi:two-component system chemotaxis sensor kinase CheA